jgi:hypothetical protein
MYVTDIRNHSQYKPALRQTLESICRTPAVATVTAVYRAVTVGKKNPAHEGATAKGGRQRRQQGGSPLAVAPPAPGKRRPSCLRSASVNGVGKKMPTGRSRHPACQPPLRWDLGGKGKGGGVSPVWERLAEWARAACQDVEEEALDPICAPRVRSPPPLPAAPAPPRRRPDSELHVDPRLDQEPICARVVSATAPRHAPPHRCRRRLPRRPSLQQVEGVAHCCC